jgi:hypothetical protein
MSKKLSEDCINAMQKDVTEDEIRSTIFAMKLLDPMGFLRGL